ncbi:M55 family metallopeptidase [Oligella urethralis]|uniref:D-aminopeptidase n=1 Tax=Oligella urethralis TaxID=90245 RepID=A0A2X1WJ44_9BURK|nr:M55 family metallopeptidase [Oligella urethralis]MDK6203474.1 M55 family metallopeptidase [Oligella urethralis]SPY08584.1 D-aminopeptidase [Oligella urethralis]SUA56298.1 D-aminopeptidase [Oligella urethralis]SUA60825.1 D-aminopeptidase [Oligella urethralis]SUA67062.1 D-aminopeptidase [Oligella urethralis]
MKILISVDIEGVAGVTHPQQVRPGNAEYEQARRWMTEETNAAIRGAFAGGASQVIVNDSHADFRNLILSELDERASIITGKPRYLGMMSGVEQQTNAIFMIGYHAKSHRAGVLAHTINSFAFKEVRVNGKAYGEAGLYGALAGEFNCPIALISGDDQFITETSELFPGVVTAQTKIAHGFTSCTSLTPKASAQLIENQATVAASTATDLKPFKINAPLQIEVDTQTPALADLFGQLPLTDRLTAYTLKFNAGSMYEAIRILNCFSAMSTMLR